MPLDIAQHPCFNEAAHRTAARIHLPVAPRCNVMCNFCDRKYDCMNESRPGVTSCVLSPGQALAYLQEAVARKPNISVMGIAGPGDPFANPEETMETLRRVRAEYPEMLLCVATNGLGLPPYIDELAALDVSHVTVTISAVDPEIGGKIYAWVRDGKRIYRGTEAGRLMIERQLESVRRLKELGIIVKVNTIVIPGLNEAHVPAIAAELGRLRVDRMNCMAMTPVKGTPFGELEELPRHAIGRLRLRAQQFVPQMMHCAKCRADAVGIVGQPNSEEMQCCLQRAAALPLEPEQDRPCVAVCSREGMLVNQHLGEAESIWVFRRDAAGNYALAGSRQAPPAGGGQSRWEALANTLHDCRALLTSGAGDSPCNALGKRGIQVVLMNGLIMDALDAVYNGRPVKSPVREHRCGVGCSGDGTGCG